jgi:signal transduction histidine kinase
VRAEATLIGVMLRNLLDNAIRYTTAGGQVRVRLVAEGGRAGFEVEDTGPGIPATDRARVFERFYRILGTDEEGSGLGLSIVKRIAELHDAEIELVAGAGGHGLKSRVVFGAAA